ncbi:hypothetical protein L249_5590 [Ophiocordyceps polyrhachis-furcata BCC 54312]|uniref:TauD/TfdA-like domain-containing protein n=1 Tax=Ophiocordyceps polyrhachis-furcata BCC 54312 TaxID=1330021 RepID=A0A367LGJ2_9HYPO|nr:hypothetical protein L249_5590 [Ophiocordyceps polyrhachis-furcata BCC 54312]
MRILCVHGAAINGEVFESKTEKVRSLLPAEYQYDWPDGDYEATPIKALSDTYPGPYLSHIEGVTTLGMEKSIERLEAFIEEDGPYDGVMAICEGAMLASALLFKRQIEDPAAPLPFRFAIFIAGFPPFTWSENIGQNVFDQLISDDPIDLDKDNFEQQEKSECKPNVERIKSLARSMYRDLGPELDRWVKALQDIGTNPDKAHLKPHVLLPQLHSDRLDLPTAHIWGRGDVLVKHSELLLRLCNPDLALSHVHEGGHDVPQSWRDNEIFGDLLNRFRVSHINNTNYSMTSPSAPSLTFQPLHPTFGAECQGVDFSRPLSRLTIDGIRQGMAKYGVLVFRRTELDDERHQQFARCFGEPDVSAIEISTVTDDEGQPYRLAPFNELVDVSNVDQRGQLDPRDSLKSQLYKANNIFHVDCSYNPRRAGYSILRAHQLPPKGTGGGTAFADTRTAYEHLDDETKREIHDYGAWHSVLHSRRLGAPELELLQAFKIEDFPRSLHRLVQLHEPSGRMNLYVAAHIYRFEGLTEKKSKPVIERLLRHASQDKYVMTVQWEDNGDVVMWDNTCVMHRACGGSYEGKHVRDMRRATVYDSSSTAWGLNEEAARQSKL